jgi:hypothetical protein
VIEAKLFMEWNVKTEWKESKELGKDLEKYTRARNFGGLRSLRAEPSRPSRRVGDADRARGANSVTSCVDRHEARFTHEDDAEKLER